MSRDLTNYEERGILKSTSRDKKRQKRSQMGVSGRSIKSTILPAIEKRAKDAKVKQEAAKKKKKAHE